MPWKPEIVEVIYGLLYRDDLGIAALVAALQELEEREGPVVFVELLYLLTDIRFEPDDARKHWDAVILHRQELEDAVGYEMALSVALVSYFVQMTPRMKHPKVIELKLFEETRASAYKDELTGLHNFRFFQEFLRWEVKRCERSGGEFSIAMGDLDNFKYYNDRFGHDAGNDALKAVGEALQEAGRDQDVAVRYGGEEFVLIMPETSKEDAGGVADRVCRAIAELELSPSPSKNGVTMSLGVASYPVDAVAPEALIRCADRAMYTAKAKGKNQTQLYGANRRALRRVRVELKGEIRVLNDKGVPFSTLNISERGLSLKAKEPLELNSMVEFVLDVPDRSEGIKAYGRVVRVYDKVDGAYEMALAIMDMDSREHLALTMFLRSQTSDEDDESERD
ncbi:MAG: diguanylate cyclase [Gemmatimonadetes bacterium]|nr:diguanylate cyclase [Gemmatimonadota bacterium]